MEMAQWKYLSGDKVAPQRWTPEVPRPVVGDAAPGRLSYSIETGSVVAAAVPGCAYEQTCIFKTQNTSHVSFY